MNQQTELLSILEKDPTYQQLLKECSAAEPAYLEALSKLPSNDREAIERYVSLCEEMDHRALILAMQSPGL